MPLKWPPRVGARIYYDSGDPETSWSAEVRAIVDGAAAVLLVSHGGRYYDVLSRSTFSAWTRDRDAGSPGPLRAGPRPRRPRGVQ